VPREIIIKARLEGNTIIIETPNYRAELTIGYAVVKTPNHNAWLDTEDVMEIDNITIDHMSPEDWEELITAIASNGNVENVLERLITTRGISEEEEEWWEE